MDAYVSQRRRDIQRRYAPAPPQSYPLEAARERLGACCRSCSAGRR